LADETPEGRSIVILAKEKYGLRGRELSSHESRFIPFSAQTRMSGVDLNGFEIRKGAVDAVTNYLAQNARPMPTEVRTAVEVGAAILLRNNLWIYGVGGVIIPFIGIKLIDVVITRLGLA
jgi:high-affinity K+ transport system ATPase subunit B